MPEQSTKQVEPIPPQEKCHLPFVDLIPGIVRAFIKVYIYKAELVLTRVSSKEILRRRLIASQLQIINECCVHIADFAQNNFQGLRTRIGAIRDEIWREAAPGDEPLSVRIRIAHAIDADTKIEELFAGLTSDLFDPRTLDVIITHGQFNLGAKGILTTEVENSDQLLARLILVSIHALYIFRRDNDAIIDVFRERADIHAAYNTYIGTLYSLTTHSLIERVPQEIKLFAEHIAEYLDAKNKELFEKKEHKVNHKY